MKTRAVSIVFTVGVLAVLPGGAMNPGVNQAAARPFMLAEPTFPDTAPGRIAKAFLEAVGDPTEAKVAAFEAAHGSSTRRAAMSIAERAERFRDLKTQWGAYTVKSVEGSSPAGISVELASASIGAVQLEFQVSSKEPGKLDSVVITSGGPAAKPQAVNKGVISEITEGAAAMLEKNYVFPEVGKSMAESIRHKLAAGEYDAIPDESILARRLTDDLQAVSHDKHLRVRLAPASPSQSHAGPMPSRDEMARQNYAFRKVEVLPGNIGYIAFDLFVEDEEAKKTAASALAFVANADALIFDLRRNGGGSPEMIRFITSYLFDEPTHLNDMIDREGKTVEEYWTLKDIPGKRFRKDLPVYVLTSSRTFSGAEEFSYNLKNLKRATIVGETTGGGAHPVRGERLSDRFMITVPFMRASNPITKTNWEGKGVAPDIETAADAALERAIGEVRKSIARP